MVAPFAFLAASVSRGRCLRFQVHDDSEMGAPSVKTRGLSAAIASGLVVISSQLQTYPSEDFPGGPEVKTPHSTAGGTGLTPGQGTKILHGAQPKNKTNKSTLLCSAFWSWGWVSKPLFCFAS